MLSFSACEGKDVIQPWCSIDGKEAAGSSSLRSHWAYRNQTQVICDCAIASMLRQRLRGDQPSELKAKKSQARQMPPAVTYARRFRQKNILRENDCCGHSRRRLSVIQPLTILCATLSWLLIVHSIRRPSCLLLLPSSSPSGHLLESSQATTLALPSAVTPSFSLLRHLLCLFSLSPRRRLRLAGNALVLHGVQHLTQRTEAWIRVKLQREKETR